MAVTRNKSVDIARGIAMVAIVLGHLGISNINRVVFTFHLPIFFLITGYYLTTNTALAITVKKRFRTLIVPYFLACFGVMVSGSFIHYLGNRLGWNSGSTKEVIKEWIYASLYGSGDSYQEPFYIKQIGAIWFLWATFWGIIFLRAILKCRKQYRIFWVLGLFAVGYYTRSICWFPLSIQAGCCAAFFMYIGHLVKIIRPYYQETSSEIKISFFMISLIAWISFMIQFQSFWLVHCDIGRGPLDVIGSLCACYVLMVICKGIDRKAPRFIRDGLSFLGQYSLFMLVAHIIELDTFPWYTFTDGILKAGYSSSVQLIVIIIGKFIWIIGITLICAKTNWIRRLFGMKLLQKSDRRSRHICCR